jgi:hypothetical protein
MAAIDINGLIMNSDSSLRMPPTLPEAAEYTGCYCEENIYLLAQTFLADPLIARTWNVLVIFISNQSQTASVHVLSRHRRSYMIFRTLGRVMVPKIIQKSWAARGLELSCRLDADRTGIVDKQLDI